LNSGEQVTSTKLNEILMYSNLSTTDEKLNILINTPSIKIKNISDKTLTKNFLEKNLKFNRTDSYPGIYIFTHVTSGKKYVGSSSQLYVRLRGYINLTQKTSGLLIPLLKKENLKHFSLEIFPFCNNYTKGSEIILEQYYLLDPSFNLNTLKVASYPGGSNAKSLYMYNRDMSVLYYSSSQQIDFIKNLSIHHTTLSKHLEAGTYYLGKYLFLREPVLTAKVKDITVVDLLLSLERDRLKFNKVKSLTKSAKAVQITNVLTKETLIFASLGQCCQFFSINGLKSSQVTLNKYIKNNKIYKGYSCNFIN
jgi:hypothetical protein